MAMNRLLGSGRAQQVSAPQAQPSTAATLLPDPVAEDKMADPAVLTAAPPPATAADHADVAAKTAEIQGGASGEGAAEGDPPMEERSEAKDRNTDESTVLEAAPTEDPKAKEAPTAPETACAEEPIGTETPTVPGMPPVEESRNNDTAAMPEAHRAEEPSDPEPALEEKGVEVDCKAPWKWFCTANA